MRLLTLETGRLLTQEMHGTTTMPEETTTMEEETTTMEVITMETIGTTTLEGMIGTIITTPVGTITMEVQATTGTTITSTHPSDDYHYYI